MNKIFVVIGLFIIFYFIINYNNKKENFYCGMTRASQDNAFFNLNESPLLFNTSRETSCNCTNPSNEKYNYEINRDPSRNSQRECKNCSQGKCNCKESLKDNEIYAVCNEGTLDGGVLTNQGDYLSAAPKRDPYFQPLMGVLGEDTLSGYPYYKAY